jgi:nitrogen fixation protein FixH
MNGTENKTESRRNLWPAAIIAYFVVFISALVTWVVYASHQRVDLVRNDYYEKEILFQQQIDATRRGQQVGMNVAYDAAQQTITIRLAESRPISATEGSIHFYRPDNARLDHDVPMSLAADGIQKINATALTPGLWKVRLSWRADGQDYYFDQPLVVGRKS